MILPLRTRLLGSFVVVIGICVTVSTVVGVSMINRGIVRQAQDKVRLDLNTARAEYGEAVTGVRDAVRYTAFRHFVQKALEEGGISALAGPLEEIRTRESLDFLNIIDASGRVVLRSRNPAATGDDRSTDACVRTALAERIVISSTEIVPREDLLIESPELARRARVEVVPGPKDFPSDRTEETAGLVIEAAAPVLDAGGELMGVLHGGRLLNRDTVLVDRIKETVYQGEVYKGIDIGTATIFQGDLRVATNVLTGAGERAIGTRVSAEVRKRVLVEGAPWTERAYGVTDWFVTAYEPIRNLSSEIIGILYVGMLERKFTDMERNVVWAFVGVSLAGLLLAVAVSWLLSRRITGPVGALVEASRRLSGGDLAQRVRPERSIEELGTLGKTFNRMASSIEERDTRLRRHAQSTIEESTKLAMVGQLAAGVAHEINNPLGGILLFGGLLLRKAPAEGVERENLERIVAEAERCKKIVGGLLEFAGQRDPKVVRLDANRVIEKTVALLDGQSLFHNIAIERRLEPGLPPIDADESQLQQVFVNIMMNAAQAMGGTGELTIETRLAPEEDEIAIRFADDGPGIPEEVRSRLFEPFFTTKEVGRGTGLGLSISHGIVERHGGTIAVESSVGEGSVFTVSLPIATNGKE